MIEDNYFIYEGTSWDIVPVEEPNQLSIETQYLDVYVQPVTPIEYINFTITMSYDNFLTEEFDEYRNTMKNDTLIQYTDDELKDYIKNGMDLDDDEIRYMAQNEETIKMINDTYMNGTLLSEDEYSRFIKAVKELADELDDISDPAADFKRSMGVIE